MHLVEQYALASGSKIGKPYLREAYYPTPADRYLTFSPFSKPSKNYDYWKETLGMLIPTLAKIGVSIVQIGDKKSNALQGCIDLRGKTSINQAAYLIKRSLLHFGADSFATHMASSFGVKSVTLYSNSPVQNCRPFWSAQNQCVNLESDKGENNPSFALEEDPKTINTIEPEKVALSILRLLNIDTKVKHKTVFIGPKWNMDFLEVVPTHVAKFSQKAPKDRHVVRMDYHFNEEVMAAQLSSNPGLVVTNKPISIDLLKSKKDSIEQVIYLLKQDEWDVNFVRSMDRANIKNSIYTNLKKEPLKRLKFDLLNLNKPISILEDKSIKEIKDYEKLNLNNLQFRSKKFVIEKDKIYPGRAAYLNGKSVDNFSAPPIPILDQPEFWEEMDFFWITESV